MFRQLRHILEMIRFSHTLFALPFALLAAVMAWALNARSQPPVPFRWLDLVGILVCMVTARSAAMAFNRLADRQIDALNPRTKMRHLPSGAAQRARGMGIHDPLFARLHPGNVALPAELDPAGRVGTGAAVPLRL